MLVVRHQVVRHPPASQPRLLPIVIVNTIGVPLVAGLTVLGLRVVDSWKHPFADVFHHSFLGLLLVCVVYYPIFFVILLVDRSILINATGFLINNLKHAIVMPLTVVGVLAILMLIETCSGP